MVTDFCGEIHIVFRHIENLPEFNRNAHVPISGHPDAGIFGYPIGLRRAWKYPVIDAEA